MQLKISTPDEFLKYIETKYAAQIPTYRGEWSGLWSESKTQSPRISAQAREVHDHAPAAETLWSAISMTRKIPFPVGNFSSIYDLMLTYDEHSGAGNNGWVQLNDRQPLEEQNKQYVEYMSKASRESEFLMNQGLSVLAQPSRYADISPLKSSNTWNALIYNGLSWNRSDVVKLNSPQKNTKIIEIRDLAANRKIKFDTDENGAAVFIARDIPSMGFRTYEVTTADGVAVSTLKESAGKSEIKNDRYRIKFRADGNVQSIFDLKQNREIINEKGELSFNELLRVEGSDASKVNYPFAPEISVFQGEQMTRIVVRRARSVFPLTTLTIYDDLDRVELHNELDAQQMPFVGGNNNWNDSYYFAFPFNVSGRNLEFKRGGQKWFDTLPEDYLPGARRDGVTTQHLIGFTDGTSTAMLAHRQSFHWVYPGYVAAKLKPQNAPKDFPAMFTGKFPLPEATIYSRAVRRSNQADTHDLGVVNMPTVEPGVDGGYIFDYAIAGGGIFNDVTAWRLGENFNVPLKSSYINALPENLSAGFFSVNQPNVQIVAVKPLSDSTVHGEVSATPLNPQLNKIFVIRLQEFAGKAAAAQINLPVKIKSASIVNLTESRILQTVTNISPLTVDLKPFETKTIRVEIE